LRKPHTAANAEIQRLHQEAARLGENAEPVNRIQFREEKTMTIGVPIDSVLKENCQIVVK